MALIFQTTKGALQQWTVTYEIAGAIDGVSLVPSAADFGVVDEEGVIRVQTDQLGIIDPDLLGGRASMGDRFITLIRIETASPIPIGFAMSVVDASLAVPTLGIIEVRRITPPSVVGQTSYISTECTYVPQGQALRLSSIGAPPPGQVHRVTITVRAAVTSDDEARLAAACCCQSDADDGGGSRGPAGPAGPPTESVQSFDFSTELISLGGDSTLAFFAFNAGYVTVDSEVGITRNLALSIQPSSGIGPAERAWNKMAMRAGTVTAMTLRADVGALSYRAFVDVGPGGGAYVRQYLMPAGVVLPGATVTAVTIVTPVSFVAGDRIRVGIEITAGIASTALEATVEITTPL